MRVYCLQDKKTGRYFRDRLDDGVKCKRPMLECRWVEDAAEATAYRQRSTAERVAKLLPQYNLKSIERN